MADKLENQLQQQHSIERAVANLKKLGKNNWTPTLLQTRIDDLKLQWEKFFAGNTLLYSIIPREERATLPYFQGDHFDATQETYLDAISFMQTQLNSLTSEKVSQPRAPTAEATDISVPDTQLPRINIPQFDGRYEKWEAFRDKFSALIIQNQKLHDVTRMHHLVSVLQGPALDSIGNLPITAGNFQIAWDTLTSLYNNPRRIITAHLSALQKLPALSHESESELQNLRDRVCCTIDSLKKLGRKPEDLWNDILVVIVSKKLDPKTRKAWKMKISDDVTPPSFDTLSKFIDSRARGLEEFLNDSDDTSSASTVATSRSASNSSRVHATIASTSASNSSTPCPLCRAPHYLNSCPKFKAKNPSGRRELVQRFSRCFNCLSHSHALRDCPSKYSCRVCHKRHHSLLHDDALSPPTPTPEFATASASPSTEVSSHLASTLAVSTSGILLATAWVQISVPSGRCVIVRALIDQGSEASFVTEAMVNLLRATRTRVATSISAVGGIHVGTLRHTVRLHVAPRNSAAPSVVTTALVIKSLSTYMPKRISNSRALEHLSHLSWADDDPSSSAEIHLLLGADVYPSIILDDLRKGSAGQPMAQNTIFGWVISGPTSSHSFNIRESSPLPHSGSTISMHHCVQDDSLSLELRKFWEIEEIPSNSPLTKEEEQCEQHFRTHTSRTSDGRYKVRLPFRTDPPIDIGQSRSSADKVLHSIHRKFLLQPSLAVEYKEFLREYEDLGHMRRAPVTSSSSQFVYIPHHPVLRADSVTTHLRYFKDSSTTKENGTLSRNQYFGRTFMLMMSSSAEMTSRKFASPVTSSYTYFNAGI
ncbi:uncharacterized protein LOC143219345 [Lasioglossum baleicum]|uniref:uncharacterized protein LOC143219345 n=1 Tax=Lasioglossum baleicum TaxID=434251 RepID=UPI003FCEE0C7